MAKNPRSGSQKRKEKMEEREKYWAQVVKEQAKKEKQKRKESKRRKKKREKQRKKRLKSEFFWSNQDRYQERIPISRSKEINRSG